MIRCVNAPCSDIIIIIASFIMLIVRLHIQDTLCSYVHVHMYACTIRKYDSTSIYIGMTPPPPPPKKKATNF